MSESLTTKSKTSSSSISSESTEFNTNRDRWTNGISYRQLVISTCIGVFQFWWHPYLQQERALIPFLVLYNILSIFVGYPALYLELALGVVTRKNVIKCWDLAPYARGIGLAMLSTCAFTAFGLGIVSAYSLALLVHSCHTFLPWLHCAASIKPPCAARHRPLSGDSETPAQSFFHNFVLNLKRDELDSGLGNIVSELTVYYVVSWILVYFIAVNKIYSYSKLVIFKDSLAFLVVICSVLGAFRLDGISIYFEKYDWNVLIEDPHIWRRALEYVILELSISQGTFIMLGSYCKEKRFSLSNTALSTFMVSKCVTLAVSYVLASTHGALVKDYGASTNITAESSAYSLIMWSDFVVRTPGSQFWSALIFFTIFTLSITSTVLLVQTIMSTFTGKSIYKISWAFLIILCFLFCLIGCFTVCTQSGILILDFLMYWPISMPRTLIIAIVTAVVTYVYGQSQFSKDIFMATGEHPSLFVRACWAISPGILMALFCVGLGFWPHREKVAGWTLLVLSLLPAVAVMMFYLFFRFRVRNIMGNEK